MQEMELYFVTGNKGKVLEVEEILGFPIRIADIDLPEIQSLDLSEIVTAKVKSAYEKIHKPVFVDDVGFFVEAWNGFPGPFIKFLHKAGGNSLLLQMMRHEKNRSVIAKGVVAYFDGSVCRLFEGEVRGQLTFEEKGTDGWGFDFVFQPDGSPLTYAEMGTPRKNMISHRSIAMNKLKNYFINLQVES